MIRQVNNYLLFFLLIIPSYAVHLQYLDLKQTKSDLNISTLDVDENTFGKKIYWLYLLKYESNEEQIETISNVTSLEHVDIYSVGQKLIPLFRNLPKIKHIAIKGNNIFYVSNGAISQVPAQEVYLDNNQIEYIENWSFGPSVNTLYLSCNKLKKFSHRWFANSSNLRELDLSGNEITALPENIFKPFKELSLIALSHNKIATIGPNAFANRNHFWIIYLDNNRLTKIPVEAFQKGHLDIHSMHLQYNRLTFLDPKFIEQTNNSKARVQGNPWQCACYEILKKWNTWKHSETNGGSKGPPKCIPAPSEGPNCITEVDFEVIKAYESKYPPKETTENFCKNYLK